ncbi:hypothetical protein CCMSSC00406_0008129 [Pleurotus cornucopiae]|uniref:Uncharacterized protein n=1 Tax=Pleurotus cornucopiae TaxID=5321 RepID=A0ACB7INI6_PLECO|nr:hypothetical protein CCMSSC00406_0008129 [Pleurotus cornucopiae]
MQTSAQNGSAENLPMELIHHIIACLEDRHDEGLYYTGHIPFGLTNCSLVCHSWNEICRHHIFRSVALLFRKSYISARLGFFYFVAPHLYKYVRNLAIVWQSWDPKDDPEGTPGWTPDAIMQFAHLSALHLDVIGFNGVVVDALSAYGIISLLSSLRLTRFDFAARGVTRRSRDLSLIISSLHSATLHGLSLSITGNLRAILTHNHSEGTETRSSLPVHLHALHTLELSSGRFQFPLTGFIECPNLTLLTVKHNSFNTPWGIPPWIPAGLHGLVLKVYEKVPVPNLGTSIRPSTLEISILQEGEDSLFKVSAWIGCCLKNLPEPGLLRGLTLTIHSLPRWGGQLYPGLAEFTALYGAIQPLKMHGGLKQIKIRILIAAAGFSAGEDSNASATMAFKEAFSPMLAEISAGGGIPRIVFHHEEVDVVMRFRIFILLALFNSQIHPVLRRKFSMQLTPNRNGDPDFESYPRGTIDPQRMPIEIADRITASLNDGEDGGTQYQEGVVPTLKACSLVCHTWNELCRPRIFRSLFVDLYKSPIDTAFLPLSFLHFSAPHIFKYITRFSFRWSRDIRDPPPWVPHALAQFTRLRSLYLYMHWDFLHDASGLRLFLSPCSSTLTELTLEECCISDRGVVNSTESAHAPPVVRLGALRKLQFVNNRNVSIPQLRHIDAPNLRALTCAYLKDPFRDISSWIPATVTDLTLNIRDFSDLPCFGGSIQPSALTIILSLSFHQEGVYIPVFARIEDCLNNLPAPHVLHRLNIKILDLQAFSDPFRYPVRTDYEILRRALLHFPAVERTDLTLNFRFFLIQRPPCGYVAELKEVFGPLMDANEIAVDVTFTKWSE